MGKIIDYTVIDEDQPHRLADKVRALLSEGWQPLGSASCSLSEADDYKYTLFAQALVKYEPEVGAIDAQDLLENASPDVLMALYELAEIVVNEGIGRGNAVAMASAYLGALGRD